MQNIQVNSQRLWNRLMRLADITVPDQPWTRRSFSPEFERGRQWLIDEFKSVGLRVSIDPAGNLIGRLNGSAKKNLPIMIGSHSDTVPFGGRFDGTLGVLSGLEVIQTLQENDVKLAHDIELVDFLAEEPSEFGLSCIGSKAMSGKLGSEQLELMDSNGRKLSDAILSVGGTPELLHQARRSKNAIAAYLEIHIEQATRLEGAGLSIGVVSDIAAIRRENIHVFGRADHAGATPMGLRKDALVTAAYLISATEELTEAANANGAAIVATIGKMNVSPNAVNAVPGAVEFILEVRSGDDEKLKAHTDALLRKYEAIARSREQVLNVQQVSCDISTKSAAKVMQAIETAARKEGLQTMRLSSGAGHDAVYAAHLGPAGMIFIPCRDGRSHTPEEWADEAKCARGAQVLLGALLELDKE